MADYQLKYTGEKIDEAIGKALSALQKAPVTSVNGKTGAVSLKASDVGAMSFREMAASVSSLSVGGSISLNEKLPDGTGFVSARVAYYGGVCAVYGSGPVRFSITGMGYGENSTVLVLAIFTVSDDRKTITLESTRRVTISDSGSVSVTTNTSVQVGPIMIMG